MRAKESVVLFFLSIQSGDWDHHGTFSWLQQLRWKCFPGQTMTYGRKSWDSLHSDSNSIGRWTIHWIITGEWKGLRRSFLVIWVFSLFSHIDNCHHLFSAAIGFASQMSHLSFCLVSPSITSVFFFFQKNLVCAYAGTKDNNSASVYDMIFNYLFTSGETTSFWRRGNRLELVAGRKITPVL